MDPMKNSEICVPLKALSLPSEGGSDVAPAEGDEVDISGTATVSRIDGDNAYLVPKTINGEAVNADAADDESAEKSPDDEEAELRAGAQAEDKKGQLY